MVDEFKNIKFTSFGNCSFIGEENPSLTPLGSYSYSSPEYMLAKNTDKCSDLWSIGCVIFNILTGTALAEGQCQIDALMKIF